MDSISVQQLWCCSGVLPVPEMCCRRCCMLDRQRTQQLEVGLTENAAPRLGTQPTTTAHSLNSVRLVGQSQPRLPVSGCHSCTAKQQNGDASS